MHLSLFLYVELISYIALDRLLDRLTCSSVFVLVLFFSILVIPICAADEVGQLSGQLLGAQ